MAFVADIMGGIAGDNADKANAAIAGENAQIEKQNATWAGQEGNAAVEQSELKNQARYGSTLANQGASGVTVGSGSFGNVLKSEKEAGELSALNIRSNAARQAYGDITAANSYQNQSAIDRYQGNAAMMVGIANGIGSLMSNGMGGGGYTPDQVFNSGFNSSGYQGSVDQINWNS